MRHQKPATFIWQISFASATLAKVRTRRSILFTFLGAAIAVGCAVWYALTICEPLYNGKPLTHWLTAYDNLQNRYQPEWTDADQAVRAAGNNAIPTLLTLVRARDSELQLRLIKLVQRQRFIAINYTPAATKNIEGSRGFHALAAQASNAVPDLVKIFEHTHSKSSRDAAAAALGWIGPGAIPAVPALLRGATSSDESIRAAAVSALNQIHPDPKLILPPLIAALHSTDAAVSTSAAYLLGNYGTNAASAVPELIQLSKGPDFNLRFYANYALKQIDPLASKASTDTTTANQ